jgi:putative hydrolase of the HAD superfamily
MEIKNIIFDLGGVILNIDYNKTIASFKSLGIPEFELMFTQAKQEHLFDKFETGEIHSNDFLNGLMEKMPNHVSKNEIKQAWNDMLLDLPSTRLILLSKLKSKYQTSLLSNTNEIHIEAFHDIIERENQIDSLTPFFESVYFSCRMGLRKPDPKIFEYVCNEQKYEPSKTLFIDDSLQHVEGAKKAGLKAFHLNGLTINDLFDDQLNLKTIDIQ